MKAVDLIVRAPHFYTMEGKGVGYKDKVSMVIDGGKISGFITRDKEAEMYQADEMLDLTHHAIFPGFIDAHMHTGFNIMRGLAQDTKNWMMYGLQPFDNVLTQEERDAGSCAAIIEAVKSGTTTLGDFESNMDNVCRFIEKIGARGNIAQIIRAAKRRVYHPGELYDFDDEQGEMSLTENIELYNKWHNKANGRIRILFGPQGADFVGLDLLLKIRKAAKERKTKIHMHVQQGDRETYQIKKRYGKRPVSWLKRIGYLDDTLIAVHLTDCTDDEAETVAKSGASMILCPGSIGIIDGIVPPSVSFQNAGGNCALGSDQAPSNNCHNMINEMKNAALFNKIKYCDPEIMPAWRALRMATIEGARAIGMEDRIGSLEAGKQADFIAIDLRSLSMQPVYTYPMRNIVPNLVYSARGYEVSHAAVDGYLILRDGKLCGIDEKEYLDALEKYPEGIGKRASEEFYKINGTNVQLMKEDRL